jgi:AraC family transcriptional regulator
MQPTRHVLLEPDPPLVALTATARGMIESTFTRAAQRAFTELMVAVADAGLLHQVRSRIGLFPDEPVGPNDARCRYLAGVLFGHELASRRGPCLQPPLALGGSLAWTTIAPGRHAVFLHAGPWNELHLTWAAIHRDWLPRSGERLRQDPPFELSLNSSDDVPPEALRTEIWIPLA